MAPRPRKQAPAAAPRRNGSVGPVADELDLRTIEGGEPFAFTHTDGDRYTLRNLGDIDLKIVEVADTGNLDDILLAVRYGLGDKTDDDYAALDEEVDPGPRALWTAFRAGALSIRGATALFETWAAKSGLRMGK